MTDWNAAYVDAGPDDNHHSTLMMRYRSGGTPWTIIIDQDGIVQFNDFGIESEQAIKLIDRLLTQRSEVKDRG